MRLCMAGEGAIGRRHLDALARIEGTDVVALVGGDAEQTARVAAERDIADWTLDLDEALARSDVDAVVLATPTQIHAAQARAVMDAGKHVLVEIPMADNLDDARQLATMRAATGRTAMVCHTRRFNPGHRWLHRRLAAGELSLQHLVVQTYFFRRSNTNALGEPRTWTDHLLWHHACHSVDLFLHQTGDEVVQWHATEGPHSAALGIAMDMGITLRSGSGALCTIALSFNNDGPLGSTFRYICDRGTYVAVNDGLVDGEGRSVEVTSPGEVTDGVEVQDREFVVAIDEGREPEASIDRCLPTMEVLDRLERCLAVVSP
ncbi:MAG: Gfo/Idh/MocA family oxidoreductase [Ilumatobacteraceae bacterium]